MNTPTSPDGRVPVRHDLLGVEPYGAPQLDVPVRLNTNETPYPPPRSFVEALVAKLDVPELNRYPDRDHVALREAIATRHALDVSQVWAANGSNEILVQLLQAYGGPGRSALTFQPSYSMYPELCRTTSTSLVTCDRDANLRLDADLARAALADHDPDLILLASPNNPVGDLVEGEVVRALHDDSRALVVVDEAYVEFAGDDASALAMLEACERLVIVRTFSKAFRLAGLRLGYLVAAPWVIADIQKVRLPYHLDTIKQMAGIIAIEQEAFFLDHRREIAVERERIVASLADTDIEVFTSAANFLLMRVGHGEVFQRLLDRGVLVRDVSSQPALAGCVRVTVGTPQENDAFIAALREVMDASGG